MAPQAPAISTPVAIIVAGALIGVGLFFGLRGRPEAASAPASAPATSTGSVALGPGPIATALENAPPVPGGPVTAPATPASTVDMKTVNAQLKTALDQHKKKMVDDCLAPSLAKKPTPASVNLTFNVSFDATGKQVGRGISEDRETSRPDVTQCVQTKLPALSIPAPGASVYVESIVWVLP